MTHRSAFATLTFLFFLHGCFGVHKSINLTYKAIGNTPETLALYEGWFGEPSHIAVGYSSHDPAVLTQQMQEARRMGISAFVVDWYADHDPFIDKTYALMQKLAGKNDFRIAMMYDQADSEVGATDQVIADLTRFHNVYLSPDSPGAKAYLTYQGRPVIFIFPHGKSTDWNKVRAVVNKWNPAPLLINENLPGRYSSAFDGYYAWINPGPRGWSNNGSNWGKEYLADFYQTMATKYPDKMIVGGAWPGFDDGKASWGLNRRIAARCGQTYRDTFSIWKKHFPAGQVIPFVLIETWNDYEEGSAIEEGLPSCGSDHDTNGE
ncbi:MAG TPA: hypothetical protein VMU92_12535 [Acidobacteriaceae bacterium]|nr:hypothetical protein [Acidobacteriaceae bacterium]